VVSICCAAVRMTPGIRCGKVGQGMVRYTWRDIIGWPNRCS
jgi:hypothetical protein